jgi:hypothetical protein
MWAEPLRHMQGIYNAPTDGDQNNHERPSSPDPPVPELWTLISGRLPSSLQPAFFRAVLDNQKQMYGQA